MRGERETLPTTVGTFFADEVLTPVKKTTPKRTPTRPKTRARKTRGPAAAAPPAEGGGFFATITKLLSSTVTDNAPRATALLEKHHRELEKLFAALESAPVDKKRTILHDIATRLLAHMVIEEKVFYPRAIGIDASKVLEGYEEHVVVRFALERALVTAPSDKTFIAKVKTIKDFLVNHDDEEEDDLFPKVRRAMSLEAQRKLGAEMLALFDKTCAEGWKATLEAEGPHVSTRVRKSSARATATAAAS